MERDHVNPELRLPPVDLACRPADIADLAVVITVGKDDSVSFLGRAVNHLAHGEERGVQICSRVVRELPEAECAVEVLEEPCLRAVAV